MMLFPLFGLGLSLTAVVEGTGILRGSCLVCCSVTGAWFSPGAGSAVSVGVTTVGAGVMSWGGVTAILLFDVSTLAGLVGRQSASVLVITGAGVGGALEARGNGSPPTSEEAGMAIS